MAARSRLDDDPQWYQDAIIYEVRVRAFYDQDGDGIGDFRGLTEKLDYLQTLGVNTIWLLPFYPSPLRDDGYDISDYTSIHPDVGTLHDFRLFLREAHERGLRVVTELVLNHTSDQHVLFQRARQAPPGSRQRDFYIWSDTTERYREARIIFKDFERSNWTWDPVAQAYYWHRFYAHQPDLNFDSPDVRRFILQVVDFWFELGVDGLRLDAVPYLYQREGTNCENLPETHAFLQQLRRHVDAKFKSRMLLAEANQWPEDAAAYFGSGDECHMAFHFPIMPRMFMALHMEDRFPIIEIISQTPSIPDSCQWAVFLRNHDELTLEMVTDEERDYMYRVYAQDPHARINLGIRHRLAPLMRNDRRRMELLNALLFSLPGTPVLYYGDEIGMGDNIFLGDRNGVRTPMQWSADRNAGFSRANAQRLYLPVIIDPEYHYEAVNVEVQQGNPHSLLRWMTRLVALRKQYAAFGRGSIDFLFPDNPQVLAFLRRHRDEIILVVANLSRFVQYVGLDLAAHAGTTPVELFGRTRFPAVGTEPYFLTLGPHGFLWFVLEPPRAAAAGASAAPSQLPTLEVRTSWEEALRGRGRDALEELLPAHLRVCPWFGPDAQQIRTAAILDAVPVPGPAPVAYVALVEVVLAERASEIYALPLAFTSGEAASQLRERAPQSIVAQLTGKRRKLDGILHDALADSRFAAAVLKLMRHRRRLRGEAGELVLTPLAAYRPVKLSLEENLAPTMFREERISTVAAYGEQVVLKLFRHLEEGVNPDVEVSRFLTERTSFRNMPPLLGTIEYRRRKGEPMTVGLVRQIVSHRGDAWSYTLDQVQLFLERALALYPDLREVPVPKKSLLDLSEEDPPALARELCGDYLKAARLLGQRTAELHVALASVTDDPAFAPEPFSTLYRRSLYQSMRNRVRQVFQLLRRRRRDMSDPVRVEAEHVLGLEDRILASCRLLLDARITAKRLRCHGRYRLRQLIYTGSDFLVAHFEGDPNRSIAERRHKRSPMRDVASMLRSIDYAALAPLLVRGVGGAAPPTDISRHEPWASLWQTWSSAAFLGAYLEIARTGGYLPTDRSQLRAMLDIYLLEEAVYTLGYELTHRPEWVRIPLHAIRHVLGDGTG